MTTCRVPCAYMRMAICHTLMRMAIKVWLSTYAYQWHRLASLACGTKAPAPPFLPLPLLRVLTRAAPTAERKRAAATTSKKMAWSYLCGRRGLQEPAWRRGLCGRRGLWRMQEHLHTHTHTLDSVMISILDMSRDIYPYLSILDISTEQEICIDRVSIRHV